MGQTHMWGQEHRHGDSLLGHKMGPDRARRFAGEECDPNLPGGGSGLSMDQVTNALKRFGLKVRTLPEPFGTLKQLQNAIDRGSPIIVSIEMHDPGDHAVVIVGYDDDHIYVNDPVVLHPDRIRKDRFKSIWSADGLVVSGTFRRNKPAKRSL